MKAIGVFSKPVCILFPVLVATLEIVRLVYNAYLETPNFTKASYFKGNYWLHTKYVIWHTFIIT